MFRTRWIGFLNASRRARGPSTCPVFLETLETRALPSFFPAVPYATGILPVAVAVGDFNGDDFGDVVTASIDVPTQSVSVLLGNGDGTFQNARHTAIGVHLRSLVLGDLNRDGFTDVVVTNFTRHQVSVLLGTGGGAFQPLMNYPTSLSPQSVAMADFNGDTFPDLVTAHPGVNALNLLRGIGDGTFQSAEVVPLGGISPTLVATGDFNRDGLSDVVTANNRSQSVSVLLGIGNGTFQEHVSYALAEGPVALVLADLNGDQLTDLVTATSSVVFVLAGNGNGTFQGPFPFSSGSSISALAVADFNRDGGPDVARASSVLNRVTVLGAHYEVGRSSGAVAVGDFNRDAFPDLVTANTGTHNVSVLLNAADWIHEPADLAGSAAPGNGDDSRHAVSSPQGPPASSPAATAAPEGEHVLPELGGTIDSPHFTAMPSKAEALAWLDNWWADFEWS